MADKKKTGFEALAQASVFTQEKLAEVKKSDQSFLIGIPKEVSMQESRVSLTPEAVRLLVSNGHRVCIERKAGEGSTFSDKAYSDAGAIIGQGAQEVYKSDVILKIEPPIIDEINLMRPGQTLISALQPGNLKKEYIHALLKKRVTALAFEYIEDRRGGVPVVRMLSEIAGNLALSIASEYLSSVHHGNGVIFGGVTGVPPARVVIIGAGTAAEYFARAALVLGAEVRVFDNNLYKLHRIKQVVGRPIYTSTIDSDALAESLRAADVALGALRAEGHQARHVVSEEMVSQMRPHSLIIDLSIDQGGCIATSEPTTHANPVFEKYGVLHYCVPNVGARAGQASARALSNIFTPILLRAAEEGGINRMILADQGLLKGIYAYKGSLVNRAIAQRCQMHYRNIELLLAAEL